MVDYLFSYELAHNGRVGQVYSYKIDSVGKITQVEAGETGVDCFVKNGLPHDVDHLYREDVFGLNGYVLMCGIGIDRDEGLGVGIVYGEDGG